MDLSNTRKCFLCVATVLSTLQVSFKPASLLTSELSCPSLYRWSSYWAEQLLVLAWDGHNLSAGSLAPCLACNHCCRTPVLTCRTQNPWGSTQHCKPSSHSSQAPATGIWRQGNNESPGEVWCTYWLCALLIPGDSELSGSQQGNLGNWGKAPCS